MPDPFSQMLEWRRAEASGRALAKLETDYYPRTARYLLELRRSYETDLRENPSGRKGEISRQTYQRASQVARDILEARMQKVLSAAFHASVGAPRDLPNALPEERAIFDRLLETLLEFRRTSAPYLEPGPTAAPAAPAVAPAPSPPIPVHPAARAAPAPVAPRPASTSIPSAAGTATAYVRIVRATRPLELSSETVDLREDDVLSLPAETAALLVGAKVADAVTAAPLAKPK